MTLPLPLGGVSDPNVRQALERIAREFPVTVTATAAATAGIGAISASNHLFTSGTVRLIGSGNVTVLSDASGAIISGSGGTGGVDFVGIAKWGADD